MTNLPVNALNEDLDQTYGENPLYTLMRNTEIDQAEPAGTMQVYDAERKALDIKNITIN